MKPFNLAEWQEKKHPVITRDGRKVEQLTNFIAPKEPCTLFGVIDEKIYWYHSTEGKYYKESNNPLDLFFDIPETIHFDFDKWKSGNYKLVSTLNGEVVQNFTYLYSLGNPIFIGVVNGFIEQWDINGKHRQIVGTSGQHLALLI